jgi:hypothetical protein
MAYINPDIFQVDFDNLTDWTSENTNGGATTISPAGQLFLDGTSMTDNGLVGVSKDLGTIGTGDHYIEIKFKVDVWDGYGTDEKGILFLQGAQTSILNTRIGNGYGAGDGILMYDGAALNLVYTATWNNDWHTITFYIHNSQTDCDIWIDKSPAEVADVTDADCSQATSTDGIMYVMSRNTVVGNGQAHIDYVYVGTSLLSATNIKTINGLAKASVKTVDGLAIASVKSVNGLT